MKKLEDNQPLDEYLKFDSKTKTCMCYRCKAEWVITSKNPFKQVKEMLKFKEKHAKCDGVLK